MGFGSRSCGATKRIVEVAIPRVDSIAMETGIWTMGTFFGDAGWRGESGKEKTGIPPGPPRPCG
jgi:hypothetical protein